MMKNRCTEAKIILTNSADGTRVWSILAVVVSMLGNICIPRVKVVKWLKIDAEEMTDGKTLTSACQGRKLLKAMQRNDGWQDAYFCV